MDIKGLIDIYSPEIVYELAQSETVAELQKRLNTYSDLKMELSLEELMAILYPLRGKKCPVDEDALGAVVGGAIPKPPMYPMSPGPTFMPSRF